MRKRIKKAALVMAVTAALILSGCGGQALIDAPAESGSDITASRPGGADISERAESGSDETASEEDGRMSYTIRRVSGETDREDIPALAAECVLWEPDCGVRARARLCHDGQRLYVLLCAVESDIRARYTEPLSPVWEDSCLELFFMPEGEERYLNFEINPNGCLHIGFGPDRNDRVVIYREDMKEYFDIRTRRTDDGWEASYSIPLEFLNIFYGDFSFSGKLRANVYKCGDAAEHRHYLSWSPVSSDKPDFHRPQDFGEMIFE